jgi:phenylacetate-CoA ligase
MQTTLGVSAKINLVEPHSLPRSEGKAVRVIDNRKI